MSTHYFHTVDEPYQVALKVEEKVERKTQQKFRGKGPQGRCKTSTTKENKKEDEASTDEMEIVEVEDLEEEEESMPSRVIGVELKVTKHPNVHTNKVPVKEMILGNI